MLVLRGRTFFESKEYAKAIEDFSKYIEFKPAANGFRWRGETFFTLKDYPNAIIDFTKTIEINPKYYLAYCNRGWTYYKLNDYSKANDDFVKIIEMEPDNPKNLSYYSQFLFILNRNNEALESLNKSFSLVLADNSALLSELWFYTYTHIPEKREETKGKLQELIEENIRKNGADSLLDEGWDFTLNIEKAIREGHPDVDSLKNFAKKITGRN